MFYKKKRHYKRTCCKNFIDWVHFAIIDKSLQSRELRIFCYDLFNPNFEIGSNRTILRFVLKRQTTKRLPLAFLAGFATSFWLQQTEDFNARGPCHCDSMGNAPVKEAAQAAITPASGEKPKCKACCACPETKKARDQCIIERGEENCGPLIEAHKKCMKEMGFNI